MLLRKRVDNGREDATVYPLLELIACLPDHCFYQLSTLI